MLELNENNSKLNKNTSKKLIKFLESHNDNEVFNLFLNLQKQKMLHNSKFKSYTPFTNNNIDWKKLEQLSNDYAYLPQYTINSPYFYKTQYKRNIENQSRKNRNEGRIRSFKRPFNQNNNKYGLCISQGFVFENQKLFLQKYKYDDRILTIGDLQMSIVFTHINTNNIKLYVLTSIYDTDKFVSMVPISNNNIYYNYLKKYISFSITTINCDEYERYKNASKNASKKKKNKQNYLDVNECLQANIQFYFYKHNAAENIELEEKTEYKKISYEQKILLQQKQQQLLRDALEALSL